MERVRYMISDAANLVNVESHVLRYWEEELDLVIPRNEMGHRYYTEENIQQFLKIKEWKEQGYQLKAIRMLVQEERMKGMAGTKKKIESVDGQMGQAMMETPENVRMMPKERLHTDEPVQNTAQNNAVKLEHFRTMMVDIVKLAMEENNQALGQEVSYQVGDKVLKEMNYLMRVQEEAEEERYLKLDAAIRAQHSGRKMRTEKPPKTKRLSRKEKKLNPNLSI